MATNIFQRKFDDAQEKTAGTVAKFRQATAFAVEMATRELPEIESALNRVDQFKRDTFGDCPESELPNNIRLILAQIQGIRGTPSTVRAALAEREQIKSERLMNGKAQFVTANVLTRLSFARGLANSAERHFTRLRLEVERFRALNDASYEEPIASSPKSEKRRQLTV